MAVGRVGTNNFNTTDFIVDTDGLSEGATHTTISAANSDASSGDRIFIRPGSYTEDFSAVSGVRYIATAVDSWLGGVTITGKVTITGTSGFHGLRFVTNSDNIVNQTAGSSEFHRCYFSCADATGINVSGGTFIARECQGNVADTGISLFTISTANDCNFINCSFSNSGSTTTASTTDTGVVALVYTSISNPLSSSSTGSINLHWSRVGTSSINTTCLTQNGSTQAFIFHSNLASGTAAALSVGASGVQTTYNLSLISTNANPITGSGRIDYNEISFQTGVTNSINTTTTNAGSINTGAISFDDGANNLDYYEEGTYTPTASGSSAAGAGTYAIQVGRYTRIGNKVFVQGYAKWTGHTGTGNLLVTGLPFTSVNVSNSFATFALWMADITTAADAYIEGTVTPNTTQGGLQYITSGSTTTQISMDTVASYIINVAYEV